jgi:putative Mn2+ efflux pump MntP
MLSRRANIFADATSILSVATSIDAFAVGISFAMMEVEIWFPILIIGAAAAVMTLFGMLLGS